MSWVLITGGTSGIGYCLAEEFAKKGYSILLVSSNQRNLTEAKQRLQVLHNVPVESICQDLSQIGAAKAVYEQVQAKKIAVDILINNAGFGLVGETEKISLQADEQLLILNVMSLVSLCKLFLPEMYRRKAGKILNVSSTGAFQPGPYTASYFASKAFVLSYSRAIRFEAKSKNVQVCTLCPGATKTNFFSRERTETPKKAMSPEAVAKIAVDKLMVNQSVMVPGLKNRLMQVFPVGIKSWFVARMKQKELTKR